MVTPDEVRQFALSLPEAQEQETWGHPTFRVRDKIFASMSEEEGTAGVKASLLDQAALVDFAPQTYGIPAYVGRYGWVSVQLASVDPDELHGLIVEAWRRTAPKGMVAAYDARER